MFVWLVGFSYVRTYFTKKELMYTIFEFGYFSLDFFCIELKGMLNGKVVALVDEFSLQ